MTRREGTAVLGRRPLRWRRLLTATLVAVSAPAAAQTRATTGAIDGIVTDSALAPLADATASLLGSSIRIVTNANGRFRIVNLPPGEYILLVRRIGYLSISAPIEVNAGDTLRSAFMMQRTVRELDTVVVAEKNYSSPIEREFDGRRRLGWGQFMTQTEIEKLNFADISDLLLTFRSIDRGMSNTRMPATQCRYQFFVDGVPLKDAARMVEELPRPGEIFGIELYDSPSTIPLEYKTFGPGGKKNSGAFCGVILVWTKRGRS